jgi:hypothetical protein
MTKRCNSWEIAVWWLAISTKARTTSSSTLPWTWLPTFV